MKFKEWIQKIESYLDKKIGIQNSDNIIKNDIVRRYAIISFILIVIALGIIVKAGILMFFERPIYQIPKSLKIELVKSIKKGCSFEDAKYVFDTKERVNITSIYYNGIEVYKYGTDFIDVMNDMIYDYYQQDIVDTFYINQLNRFRTEAKEKYPFDKLNFSQKELFKKLRDDSGDLYPLIEGDVLSIASELYDKNEDIERYLADAESSYVLSIIAFYISLVPFLLPLWRLVKKIFH